MGRRTIGSIGLAGQLNGDRLDRGNPIRRAYLNEPCGRKAEKRCFPLPFTAKTRSMETNWVARRSK
ncbi:hypothetical protein RB9959 [Rhodopirellula baltica SH 1]|uniref:Uncharacterized protein n=1 Tax=Rhodopirellula baltica (strain DSM 10527 / NCIMB 13988 / SH1) TaxID=243090 RepID=Q7UKT2_RHOBA|nr:hypothetical protein RB9959 [Rhodopirellula baltica SH 1]